MALSSWFHSIRGLYGLQARQLAMIVAITILVYSCAGHKEWRFIHPLLPIIHTLTSKGIVDSYLAQGAPEGKAMNDRSPAKRHGRKRENVSLAIRRSHFLLILSSLPVAFYVMRYHGRGQIAVMYRLRDIPISELHSIGFLMPCHSTPWQAYLHKPELDGGRLWGLGCEPPLRFVVILPLSLRKVTMMYFYIL